MDGASLLASGARHLPVLREGEVAGVVSSSDLLECQATGPLALRRHAAAPVNLELQGLAPIVYLARCYALEVGSRARSTRERLAAAVAAGLMGEEVFVTVSEAYRYLLGLRLRHQLRRSAEGRAVKAWQEKAAYHCQAGF